MRQMACEGFIASKVTRSALGQGYHKLSHMRCRAQFCLC